ncbi:MAG: SDR family NAD(P)-dependent oxidoreductase [Fidelibacterota bacterium]
MAIHFKDKRAIVTGASSGIGKGIALRFAELGVKVVLTARRLEELEGVAADITAKDGSAIVVPGDVTNPKEVEHVVRTAKDELGGVDILVNCAGVAGPMIFEETPRERIHQHMAVNYFGAVEFIQNVLPIMKEQGDGYIVNISSISGLKGLPTYVSYGASKFALYGFSDALRHEVKKYGIKISVVAPPGVHTPMVDDDLDSHADWFHKFRVLEVKQVLDKLISGMRKGRFLILVSADTKLMYAMVRFFPRAFTTLLMWLYKMEK